jgi:acid phosphatase (class A)
MAKVLPAPLEVGSLAGQADLEAVRMAQAWRTPEQVVWAKRVEAEDPFDFAQALGPWFTAGELPLCARFLEDVTRDVKAVNDHAKGLYQRKRPFQIDSEVQPCVLRPFSSSYPSGHSTRAFARALALAEVFPEHRSALLELAHRDAWGRILGGVHFPSDDVGGRLLAEAVVAEMKKSPAFRDAAQACRKEAEPRMGKAVAGP